MAPKMPEYLPSFFVNGVWGKNARVRNDFNGGPLCAKQSTPSVKLSINLCLLPFYVWGYLVLHNILHRRMRHRVALDEVGNPTKIEKAMGYLCLAVLAYNVYLKVVAETLIFIINPCHVNCLLLAIISLNKNSLVTEMCALGFFSSNFGGWIGIIFSENEELGMLEIVVYYIEHAFASFLGAVVLTYAGRYDIRKYLSFTNIIGGFLYFTTYMRWLLMPLSAYTWANLNHTLCGVDNDPFFKHFNLGWTYYFWADFYLLFSCWVGWLLNFLIVTAIFKAATMTGLYTEPEPTKHKAK
jgi:hypothetical protein